MIEITIKEYLESCLNVPVCLQYPENAPVSFVLLEKTGSNKKDKLQSSTFAFQSYAQSLYQAAALNEDLKDKLEQMAALNCIGSIRLNSDYNFTDTATKQYRYQAVYDISHY